MRKLQLIKAGLIAASLLSLSTVKVYAKWKTVAQVPTSGRWSAMMFAVNDKIYIGGGYKGNLQSFNDLLSYDITGNKWNFLAGLPTNVTSRTAGVTFTANGKAYVGLGAQDYNNFSPPPMFLKDIWEYDPATNKWTQKADLIDSGRADAAWFALNNKLYVVGGHISSMDASARTFEYDPATNKWTKKKDCPVTIANATGFAVNGKGYVVAGAQDGIAANDLYEYNPTGDTWTKKKAYPESQLQGGVAFTINNKAYVGLGAVDPYVSASAKYSNYFYTYNPASDSWSYAGGFEVGSQGRMFSVAAVMNNKAYIGNGWRLDGTSTQTFFNDWYEIDPAVATGIEETPDNELKVYPLPTSGLLHISGSTTGTRYTVTDMTGRLIKQGELNDNTINISECAPGNYILEITSATQSARRLVTKE